MSVLFGIAGVMLTLFILFITWFMWSEKDIPQAIVCTFVSAFLLIKWYGFIFNG